MLAVATPSELEYVVAVVVVTAAPVPPVIVHVTGTPISRLPEASLIVAVTSTAPASTPSPAEIDNGVTVAFATPRVVFEDVTETVETAAPP